jgi:hypothetical protein
MVLLGAAPAARADVFSSHIHGNGAVAIFDRTDGCIERTAVVVQDSTNGTLVFAQRIDNCNFTVDTYFTDGSQAISGSSSGLASASVSGSGDIAGFPDIDTPHVAVALTWSGTGASRNEHSSSRSVGRDGVTLELSSATTRNATLVGTLTFDGVDLSGSATTALLYSSATGELSVP